MSFGQFIIELWSSRAHRMAKRLPGCTKIMKMQLNFLPKMQNTCPQKVTYERTLPTARTMWIRGKARPVVTIFGVVLYVFFVWPYSTFPPPSLQLFVVRCASIKCWHKSFEPAHKVGAHCVCLMRMQRRWATIVIRDHRVSQLCDLIM